MKKDAFPTKWHVEKFKYNGFIVHCFSGFYKWTIKEFVKWTDDSGIISFTCSDGKNRLVPSCSINPELYNELPKAPILKPLVGIGVLFGTPSNPT